MQPVKRHSVLAKAVCVISCNNIKRKPLFNNSWLHPYHSPQRSPTAVYPGQNTIHNLTLTQTAKVWLRHSTHTTLGLVTQQGVTVHTTDLICVCTHTEHRTLRSLTTEHMLAWNTIKLYVCIVALLSTTEGGYTEKLSKYICRLSSILTNSELQK